MFISTRSQNEASAPVNNGRCQTYG